MASRTDAHERALLIDGEWVTTGEWIDVVSPYTGKTVGRVARGGRAEAEAAHIRSVEANGPDIITNGIALSGTVHWMFDRGLISLSDDLEILLSKKINDIDGVRKLINPNARARLPKHSEWRPHPRYLSWHREECFDG